MATRILRLRTQLVQRYTNNTTTIRNRFDAIQSKVTSIELPERFKGTVVEKWAAYWKALARDYRDVAIDVYKFGREKPIRAGIYGALAASIVYSCKRNPDDVTYINHLRLHNINMVMVSDDCRSPVSSQYSTFVERCYNEGIVRRLNIGVASILWLDNYDRAICLYRATCKHTKYDLLSWHQRIIDVGFLGKWWNLEKAMVDYDVNEANL